MTLLDDIQRKIDAVGRLTLSPDRAVATSLTDIVETVARTEERDKFGSALARVAEAQLESFPQNLLWDFDYMAAELVRHARQSDDFETTLDDFVARTTTLMQLYGTHSPIRFRYVHDFVYGFDWARWVRKAPSERAGLPPFGPDYLDRSNRRAHELLALIAEDSDSYPRLPTGELRNPFSFSREPEDELALYRDLASRDALPIRAWDGDARPVWDLPHDEIRRTRAATLGLKRLVAPLR